MRDENCIFCKIANGDIPTYQLYENEDFRVIFDAAPATRGHALILPKNHYADIFEADEVTVAKAFALAKQMAEVMRNVLGCDGINIIQNNGREAGQTVFHLHVHLIPRYEGQEKILTWKQHEHSKRDMEELVRQIAEEMNK
ncbi:HIT family protein [Parasporobacterium paucivorans]|uniref:Histidine triad (HIT) family protein n=1 Tax=Parasporobacterium paucivorans DSM 15970 TaxID=1122934 RepID=A0A1M6J9Q8_9FIRM|nr:HIT family protein [Parasporobacterium paucivorans]SHJ43435.1 histidine triad (HIT) family protein [Parasporobacterium paucivorans DSM 15970]